MATVSTLTGTKRDPDVIYSQYQGGRISRTNQKTGESKYIKPFPEEGVKDLRFNWNTPTVFGKKSGWLYVGSQYLFRSKDKGDSFEKISPDLTTNDPLRQVQEKSGGLTIDNSTAENNTTIFTVSESPLDENIVWAGTDDGNIQLTTDGGKNWSKLNGAVPGLPAFAFISHIDADNFNKDAAWVTVDAHRNGDMKPYVYYTEDLGKTWSSLATTDIKGLLSRNQTGSGQSKPDLSRNRDGPFCKRGSRKSMGKAEKQDTADRDL